MSLVTWARERFAPAPARPVPVQRTSARVVSTWQQGKPLPRHDNYVELAQTLVRRNVIAAACIWEIVTSAAEPELIVEQRKSVQGKDEWVRVPDSHDLATLLREPNPEETQDELFERLLTHQHIGGQWSLHKARSSSGRIVELWALRPDRLTTVPGGNGLTAGYVFKDDKGKGTPIGVDDVVTCMLRADPLDDYYGLSPLAVLSLFGDLDNKAAEYLRSFFYNGGAPAGLLKLKNAVLEEPDRVRLKEAWTREHQGQTGWHTVSVLDADADYQEIGSRPENLKMEAIWDETEARICSAFGVPPILVGANIGLKRATYANYAEARQSFWQETMPLILRRTSTKLTKGVASEWGADYRCRYELTGVKALQVDETPIREQAVAEYNAGLITLNEARQKCGYDPVEGPDGDQRKQPAPPKAPGAPDDSPLEQQFGDLLTRVKQLEAHERHGAPLLPARRAALRQAAERHFAALGPALVDHLKAKLEE